MEQEGGGQDARATVDEAIRRHLRPELVNRATRIVHFKPLGMATAREILAKMVRELNDRLADAVGAELPQLPGGETPPARPAAGRGSHAHVRGVNQELAMHPGKRLGTFRGAPGLGHSGVARRFPPQSIHSPAQARAKVWSAVGSAQPATPLWLNRESCGYTIFHVEDFNIQHSTFNFQHSMIK